MKSFLMNRTVLLCSGRFIGGYSNIISAYSSIDLSKVKYAISFSSSWHSIKLYKELYYIDSYNVISDDLLLLTSTSVSH